MSVKFTDLPQATVPLDGTEIACVVQDGESRQVMVSDLPAPTSFGDGWNWQFTVPANEITFYYQNGVNAWLDVFDDGTSGGVLISGYGTIPYLEFDALPGTSMIFNGNQVNLQVGDAFNVIVGADWAATVTGNIAFGTTVGNVQLNGGTAAFLLETGGASWTADLINVSSSDESTYAAGTRILLNAGTFLYFLATTYIRLDLTQGLRINNDSGEIGQVLTSQGAGSPPIWAFPSEANVGVQSIATAGTQNNLALTNARVAFLEITPSGAYELTGMVAEYDGQIVTISCLDAVNAVTLRSLTGSTAGNQFRLPADITLLQYMSATLRYSATIGKWVPFG